MKKGPPAIAVIIPTGNSAAPVKILRLHHIRQEILHLQLLMRVTGVDGQVP